MTTEEFAALAIDWRIKNTIVHEMKMSYKDPYPTAVEVETEAFHRMRDALDLLILERSE